MGNDDFPTDDYLLAVDSCCHSTEEAIQGFNEHGGQHMSGGEDFGTYQITFSGDVTVQNTQVSEPTFLALLGLGLTI
jgi:hypothetical protein